MSLPPPGGTEEKNESSSLFLLIPLLVKTKDELHYANNILPIEPRYIMAVGNKSQYLQDAVAAHGVDVMWIPLETLIKGYGAARCMTQVIRVEVAK